ncbi:polyprenyl synthetase family protein [Limnohabitans sp. Bal53]|jgi:farnesyl diphosphate synthase|uniref:polyprenyl synthetase family protein n=1 Tax=Limnohabitans sp. Bal53 TaxID=1977910 RepID=UPI000D3AFDFA|nr:farnesyl diphosphate synthase [Limnohabitans sp. Bal53]PUE40094.1 polyprenyl synthetase [Limnohabitans sp. Bal53]
MSVDLKAWMQPHLERVEQALSAGIVAESPAALGQAMRYAVLDGGKRLRPLLVLATAEAVGNEASSPAALNAACAIELIHAYSLVHDDMPCMDNDVLRRGKPTVHVQFGEAQALLAGDALQTLAFEFLTPLDGSVSAPVQAACVGLLARASGYQGMAGGQAIDLASVGQRLSEDQLRQMHRLKTGALLLCSVQMGVACVPGVPEPVQAALTRFGEALGLAFQVVDDVLDVTADSATLGKTAGKDEAADKPTYVALMGLEAAKAYADSLAAQAMQALANTGLPEGRLAALRALTAMVVERNN